ncbi:MAG: 4Fe-4S dicluster domain-containing protein [Candidatus Baldrarchaeia archaeon]
MPPVIDESKCEGCGECVEACPQGVLELDEETGKAKVAHPEECVECESCVDACPNNAISME